MGKLVVSKTTSTTVAKTSASELVNDAITVLIVASSLPAGIGSRGLVGIQEEHR